MRPVVMFSLVPVALAIAASLPAQNTVNAVNGVEPGIELSKTRGLALGLHLDASSIAPSDGTAERGFGGGARLGYGISDKVILFAEVDAASLGYADGPGSYTLAHVGLGARASLGVTQAKLRPYFEGALVGVGVADDVEGSSVVLSGAALQGGMGLEYFVSRRLAVDGGLQVGPGSLSRATVDGDEVDFDSLNFTSVRFNLGFVFHP